MRRRRHLQTAPGSIAVSGLERLAVRSTAGRFTTAKETKYAKVLRTLSFAYLAYFAIVFPSENWAKLRFHATDRLQFA